jgi:Chromo (CHRromatin Organisation MOdifier) domain
MAEQEPYRRSPQIGRNPDDSDMHYVVDRIVDHAPNDANNRYLVRVRWAGYNTRDDTWEPAAALPSAFLKRYEKRKKIRPSSLLISPAQRNSRLGTANPAN